jgi:epoxyqueuosine reductase
MLVMASREERVLRIAEDLGFDLAGIAPLTPPARAGEFEQWLDDGFHASMDYLERNRDRIADPRRVLPEGRSMLIVGLGHSRAPVELPGGGRVARYAAGRDYHNVIGRLLKRLAKRLQEEGLLGRKRSVTDAGPILERSHAAEAGLGFESKAANLLHPRFGPWFFLGELLLEDELEPTGTAPAGSCGTCTACIDACPTKAIVAPGRVDASACISYQTIENRGSIPHELRESFGGWVFGCDVCSEVCPWGHDAPDLSARFGTHPAVEDVGLTEWLAVQEEAFPTWLEGSPLKRPRRPGLARNAAIALGNLPTGEGRRALLEALESDPSALVREAAAWGLIRGHGDDAGTRASVEAALEREPDDEARAGMARSLARL